MDDDVIRQQAQAWWERLDQARRSAGEHCARNVADWERWRRAVDPDAAGLFERRLAWDNLTEAEARGALVDTEPDPAPDWWDDFGELRHAAARAGRSFEALDSDVAFADVLQPIVDWGWRHLKTRSDVTAALLPAARANLRRGLLGRLSNLCAQALYDDFRAQRPAGVNVLLELGVPVPAQQGRYHEWCRDTLSEGYGGVLARCPVLARLMTTLVRNWIETTAEMLQRVNDDRAVIHRDFGIPAQERIAGIDAEVGDPHRGGRSVVVLAFGEGASDRRLVYKPKDLRIEERFQHVLHAVGGWIGESVGAPVTVLARGGAYGYVSFVERMTCSTPKQLKGFYRSAGRLLAVLHLLGATDAHFENLVATGSGLVLVDTETLFQGRTLPSIEASGAMPADPIFASSVLRVGMLPTWLVTGKDQRAFDISGLGVHSPSAQEPRSGWLDVNTDRVAWGALLADPREPSSLPVGPGARNPLREHVAEVVAGFTAVYEAAMRPALREQLLALISGFTGVSRRLVLRATRVYAVVQRRALSADSLASTNHRGAELERLARSSLVSPERTAHWDVFCAELRDMEDLDVPYFDYPLGSRVVRSSIGPIEGLLPSDGLAEARTRVLSLSQADLVWQSRLIRMSVQARYATLQWGGHRTPDVSGSTREQSDHSSVVRRVLTDLDEAAVEEGAGGRTWLTLSRLPDGVHVQLGPVGHALYDGRAGMAAVVDLAAEADIVTGGRRLRDELLSPLADVLRTNRPYDRFRYLRDMGLGMAGVGGVLRALQRLDEGAAGELCAALTPELVERDQRLDFMGGCAGLVGPLIRQYRRTRRESLLTLVRAAATRLVDTQRVSGGWQSEFGTEPLTGLSHGASGHGLALLMAGAALDDSDLVAAGARAFGYEAAVFDAEAGNWPDFRESAAARPEPKFMVAWCHGAPGIGLARLRALQVLPDHRDAALWQRDLDAAMITTATADLADVDHLCCGTIGRAAILRIAAAAGVRPDWEAAAERLTDVVLDGYGGRGRFRLPLDDPQAEFQPGLMTGSPGIAAHLVTVVTGDHLGDLLL